MVPARVFLVFAVACAPSGAAALRTVQNAGRGTDVSAFDGKSLTDMRPEVVAALLKDVESSWVQRRAGVLAGVAEEGSVRGDMLASCSKVAASVVRGSDGDWSRVSEYMKAVCEKQQEGKMCQQFATGVLGFMRGDERFNREDLDMNVFCGKFYNGAVLDAAQALWEEQKVAKAKAEDEEAKAKAQKEKEEAEAKAQKEKAEAEAKAQKEKEEAEAAVARAQAEKEAKAAKEVKAKAKAEEVAAAAARALAKAEADKEAKEKADEEAKMREDADARAKAFEDAESKAEQEKQEAEAKAEQEKQEAEAKAEQEANAKAEEEAKDEKEKEEADARAKVEAEAKANAKPEVTFEVDAGANDTSTDAAPKIVPVAVPANGSVPEVSFTIEPVTP